MDESGVVKTPSNTLKLLFLCPPVRYVFETHAIWICIYWTCTHCARKGRRSSFIPTRSSNFIFRSVFLQLFGDIKVKLTNQESVMFNLRRVLKQTLPFTFHLNHAGLLIFTQHVCRSGFNWNFHNWNISLCMVLFKDSTLFESTGNQTDSWRRPHPASVLCVAGVRSVLWLLFKGLSQENTLWCLSCSSLLNV